MRRPRRAAYRDFSVMVGIAEDRTGPLPPQRRSAGARATVARRAPWRALAPLLVAGPLAVAPAQAQQSLFSDRPFLPSIFGERSGPAPAGASAPAVPSPIADPVNEVTTEITRREVRDDGLTSDVGDVLLDSPGVIVSQGANPREAAIAIRGNNSTVRVGPRSFVVWQDGFQVTQANGSPAINNPDAHSLSRIDVFRGPQSPLFGNYATGGALAYYTRRGASVNGAEIGFDAGSFGALSNYGLFGGVSGPFEYRLFASDTRGNGYLPHGSFNVQTVDFLGTYTLTPDDRFTLKLVHDESDANLPLYSSLLGFRLNPFQRGCTSGRTAAPGCPVLYANGVPVAAGEFGNSIATRRTLVGGRYEHDFDAFTTWRTQLVVSANEAGGVGSTAPELVTSGADRGRFSAGRIASTERSPGVNLLTSVTRQDDLFGLPATGYVALAYSSVDVNRSSRTTALLGAAQQGGQISDGSATQSNLGGRARLELQLSDRWIAVAGIGAENTAIDGRTNFVSRAWAVDIDRTFLNVAPELSLAYLPDPDWRILGRVATGYATPTAGQLTVTPAGLPGNNTQLQAQRNVSFDLETSWNPLPELRFSVAGFYELFRNALVSQSPGAGAQLLAYTFNAPGSEARGVEVGGDWASPEGWRVRLAYTHVDQVFTDYFERLDDGDRVGTFNRAGRHLPGVPTDQLLLRLGYEQTTGPLAGLGGHVEAVYQSDFYLDNANLLKAPGATIANAYVHYDTPLAGYAKRLSLYFGVRNVFDQAYARPILTIPDTISARTGLENGAGVLAQRPGSIAAGPPRSFIGGMRVAF